MIPNRTFRFATEWFGVAVRFRTSAVTSSVSSCHFTLPVSPDGAPGSPSQLQP